MAGKGLHSYTVQEAQNATMGQAGSVYLDTDGTTFTPTSGVVVAITMISDTDFGSFINSNIKLHPTCGFLNDKQHYGDGDLRAVIPQDWILKRQAKICELNNGGIINISMNGNTLMTVGDVVHINLPITGEDHDDDEIESTSGNYLITKLRHSIAPQQKQHEIHMQVVRDSAIKSYKQMEV